MGKISLILIIIVASTTFYFTSESFKQSPQTAQNRTYFDEQNHLHVMGIVLGESTVRDAERAFRSRSEAAIFMYPKVANENNSSTEYNVSLEAYFLSIADHSKVLLKLIVDDNTLDAMQKRSTSPRLYPNGVARRNLMGDDVIAVLHFKIQKLTLIPSVDLDTDMIFAQFGTPKTTTIMNEHTTSYSFPQLGLVATLHDDEKDTLVFSNNL